MSDAFSEIHNHHERLVIDTVVAMAPGYPALGGDPDLLADVACVALNHLPPRYIRHAVDLAFYLTEAERLKNDRALRVAVARAFEFVQARAVVGARH
jgi:hypothetical protein